MSAGRHNIIISNGFNKFHLVHAATAMAAADRLDLFITGAYPPRSRWGEIVLAGLVGQRKLARLRDRRGDISAARVHDLPWTELALVAAGPLSRWPAQAPAGDWLQRRALHLYGRAAARIIDARAGDGGLYHYRAGFGQASVDAARRRGMRILCDHSIAHPSLVDPLIDTGGRLPDTGTLPAPSAFWRMILDDIHRADHVLVNSDFVKQTFLHLGWPADRIDVVYLGVDEAFLAACPPRPPADPHDRRLMFAGQFGTRKGADILVESLAMLPPTEWSLDLVGPLDPDAARRHRSFLSRPQVRHLGTQGRRELAATMSTRRILVFPSLVEGSARVVTEAMAAGCFIITTPNAGSPVRDGRDGLLIPPGDPAALAQAITRTWAMGTEVDRIGADNADRIRRQYRLADYAAGLNGVYDRLLALGSSNPEP